MQFIKNKTTNQSKVLLTSSLLILNGNMCNSTLKPSQQLLKKTGTNSCSMIKTEYDSGIGETFNELEKNLGKLSLNVEKLKKQLPTQNPTRYEAYNKWYDRGYDGGDESEDKNDSETKKKPNNEETNYKKIGQRKNNSQAYNNHTKNHYFQGYSSGSDSAYHTDTGLKDDGQKSDNGNDSNEHIYATIDPPITADKETNGKQSNEPNPHHQPYNSDNDREKPIYEELENSKNDGASKTSSNMYDSGCEPNDALNHEPTNEATTGIISNREATKEIKIMENLQIISDEVHKYIPEIRNYELIKKLQLIVSTMNRIARARKKKDHLLTEEQKEQFRYLKLNIRSKDQPCYDVIELYKKIHNSLNNSINLTKEDKKRWCNEAKEIQPTLKKLLEDVKKLTSTIPPHIIPVTDL